MKRRKETRDRVDRGLHEACGVCCLDLGFFSSLVFVFKRGGNIRMFEGRHERMRERGRY